MIIKNANVSTMTVNSAGSMEEQKNSVLNKTTDSGSVGNASVTPKRFIAGAICPQCQRVDKIVVYSSNDVKKAECVSCGFLQQDPASTNE